MSRLNRDYFEAWLNYLMQVKGWQLNESALDVLYDQCSVVSDHEFETIANSISEKERARPESLIAAVREYRRLSNNQQTPALSAGAIDPSGRLEGLAAVSWQMSYCKARTINPSLPALSRLNPNDYGIIQDPLYPQLERLILDRFGSWQNAPRFDRGRCAPIEQMIESLWKTQLNPPPSPFDQPVGTSQPTTAIGTVISEIYREAA